MDAKLSVKQIRKRFIKRVKKCNTSDDVQFKKIVRETLLFLLDKATPDEKATQVKKASREKLYCHIDPDHDRELRKRSGHLWA